MNKKERIYIYIDGGNLYHNLKQTGFNSMNFDFKKFIGSFIKNRKIEGVRYYIGQIKPIDGDKKSQTLHKHQQIL